MSKLKTKMSDLNQAEHDLAYKRQQYLIERGWEHTCNTPGSFWVWRRSFKDFDEWRAKEHAEGRLQGAEPKPFGVITVIEPAHAVQMSQVSLEEFYRANPPEAE